MKTNRLFLIAALLGTVLAGCQKAEELMPVEKPERTPSTEQYLSMTVQANLGVDSKALELDDDQLKTYWKQGEKVAVYFGGEKIGTLEVTTETKATPATLSGKIKKVDGFENGSTLLLLSPARDDEEWTYLGQDGSAPSESGSLATCFDYETATITASNVADNTVTVSDATFSSEQSMFRLAFKVGDDPAPIAVSSFIVNSGQGKIVRGRTLGDNWTTSQTEDYGSLTLTPSTASVGNIYYMAIRNEHTSGADDHLFFSVTGSDKTLYLGSKKIPQSYLGYEKFIGATVKLTQVDFTPKSSTTDVAL